MMLMPPAPTQSLAVISESRKPEPEVELETVGREPRDARFEAADVGRSDVPRRLRRERRDEHECEAVLDFRVEQRGVPAQRAVRADDALKPSSKPSVSSWSYESRTPCGRPGTPAPTSVATPTATPLRLNPPLRKPSAYDAVDRPVVVRPPAQRDLRLHGIELGLAHVALTAAREREHRQKLVRAP